MTVRDAGENPSEFSTYPDSASVQVVTQDGHHQSFGEMAKNHYREALVWARKIAPTQGDVLVRVYEYYPGGRVLRAARIAPSGDVVDREFATQYGQVKLPARFNPGGPHERGVCGPVCTFGES
jgi:hypothetical protein